MALRRGWTTGACATAATKAAYTALRTGVFPDPVTIALPGGLQPSFPLALREVGAGWARAGVVKDAGDDPDVTHGATVIATVRMGAPGSGVRFVAGDGVGTVTLPGLPVAVGEPAINPVPRRMMALAVDGADVEIEVAIPGGAVIATQTWNPRLGIVGGLSILGTTGVVIPYSCSAWIHSIRSGVDVARSIGHAHLAGCTGSTSEAAVQQHLALPDTAMIDMGDFVGPMLRYIRTHPVARITIGGGFAKVSKLAAGALDLHSSRSQVDFGWLADRDDEVGGSAEEQRRIRSANTALEVLVVAGSNAPALAASVAHRGRQVAAAVVEGTGVEVDVVVVDRGGSVLATSM